jgi:hypothetical protein
MGRWIATARRHRRRAASGVGQLQFAWSPPECGSATSLCQSGFVGTQSIDLADHIAVARRGLSAVGEGAAYHRHRIRTGLFEPKSLLPGNGIFRAETKRSKRLRKGQGHRGRDNVSLNNPANSGLVDSNHGSARLGMRDLREEIPTARSLNPISSGFSRRLLGTQRVHKGKPAIGLLMVVPI